MIGWLLLGSIALGIGAAVARAIRETEVVRRWQCRAIARRAERRAWRMLRDECARRPALEPHGSAPSTWRPRRGGR